MFIVWRLASEQNCPYDYEDSFNDVDDDYNYDDYYYLLLNDQINSIAMVFVLDVVFVFEP